jgi:hypothetical protein
MEYGKAKWTRGPRYWRRIEPAFQHHGLARVQRRQRYRPAGVPLAPTGNYRRIPVAVDTNLMRPSATSAPPPSSPVEETPPETAAKTHRALGAPAPDVFPERDGMGGTWSSAWAVVGVLLLALVVVSSLSTTRPALTDDVVARAAHHMPRERGVDGRN